LIFREKAYLDITLTENVRPDATWRDLRLSSRLIPNQQTGYPANKAGSTVSDGVGVKGTGSMVCPASVLAMIHMVSMVPMVTTLTTLHLVPLIYTHNIWYTISSGINGIYILYVVYNSISPLGGVYYLYTTT